MEIPLKKYFVGYYLIDTSIYFDYGSVEGPKLSKGKKKTDLSVFLSATCSDKKS